MDELYVRCSIVRFYCISLHNVRNEVVKLILTKIIVDQLCRNSYIQKHEVILLLLITISFLKLSLLLIYDQKADLFSILWYIFVLKLNIY